MSPGEVGALEDRVEGPHWGLVSHPVGGCPVKTERACFVKLLGTLGQSKTTLEFRVLREIQKVIAFSCIIFGL